MKEMVGDGSAKRARESERSEAELCVCRLLVNEKGKARLHGTIETIQREDLPETVAAHESTAEWDM